MEKIARHVILNLTGRVLVGVPAHVITTRPDRLSAGDGLRDAVNRLLPSGKRTLTIEGDAALIDHLLTVKGTNGRSLLSELDEAKDCEVHRVTIPSASPIRDAPPVPQPPLDFELDPFLDV